MAAAAATRGWMVWCVEGTPPDQRHAGGSKASYEVSRGFIDTTTTRRSVQGLGSRVSVASVTRPLPCVYATTLPVVRVRGRGPRARFDS